MFKIFSSVKLTLFLLLLLAVLSIAGTITPVDAQRYELFYQSLWFRVLLGLLALNLICCTVKSFPLKWHYRRQFHEILRTRQGGGEILSTGLGEGLEERLSAAGYDLQADADQLLAERGGMGRWGSTLVHISILLIMCGGLLGETGFVGTINSYLHQPNHLYFDWDAQENRELGFLLRVDAFRLRYYPIQLRFELFDVASGTNYGQLMLYDNQSFNVPDSTLSAQLRGFDPEARLLTMDVLDQGTLVGQYLFGEEFEQYGNLQYPAFRLRNLEFRDPVLKQMEAEVSVLEAGQLITQRTIRVNEPLTFRGVSIYQTAYGQDEFGNRSVGFQLSKDPGEMLVWVATVLLMIGFGLAFLLPRRVLGVKPVAGQDQLYPLSGWRGEAGRQQFANLLKSLNS